MASEKPRREWYLPERTQYAAQIGLRTGILGGAGYLTKVGLKAAGAFLDIFHNKIIPKAAEVDEKIGVVIIEKGGKVGETVVKVDKAQGDFWSRVFGRSEEDQRKWREEHGIKEPSYTEKSQETPEREVIAVPPKVKDPVVTSYENEFAQYGDSFVALGLIAGAAWGLVNGFGGYITGKRQRDTINASLELNKTTKDLSTLLREHKKALENIERRVDEP